jgi:hypothetical protein
MAIPFTVPTQGISMLICVRKQVHLCLFVLLIVTSCASFTFGQGTKVRSQFEATDDEDADRPWERDQWFLHGRLIPGQSAAALRYRAHSQKIRLRAARRAAEGGGPAGRFQGSGSSPAWIPLGPAPLASDASGAGFQDYGWVSGRATAIAIDPADSTGSTVYVGGADGGLWRSRNATDGSFGNATGVGWTALIDDQATLAVGAIALQPGNANGSLSNVILAGTGEANSSADSYYGLGILRSTDGGNSWNLVGTASPGLSLAGLGTARMVFSTAQTSTVVAAMATSAVAAGDGLVTAGTQRGLYTSVNAGQSWTFDPLTDPGGAVYPATSATSVAYNETAGKFFASVRYHGFYSSPDGLAWTRLASQPGGAVLSTAACPANYTAVTIPCPMYRGEITVVPKRNEMYAWYVDGGGTDKGIFRSTDGGTSWIQIDESGLTWCGDPTGCGTQQGAYNLEVAAVPNGNTATDLYAGAVNLYKCTLNTNSSTSCSQGSWLNLTHVYGCSNPGAPAHVHPDQHDVRFALVNGKDVMYFANDGGVYRALDGFLGLATGSCTGSNQFDSLNQGLGSMTQFVWFSQHPTDANILLGGTQGNGSPATTSSQTSTQWGNVNSGDGGYSAINPSDSGEWFTANTGVSIQRCATAPNCTSVDFTQVVDATDVGGDFSAFYLPYMLDPQSTGEILVGTCRVWRGTSAGAGFSALSNSFETNSPSICENDSINFIRSLAAGGAKDTNGFSNVIYAGTDGLGVGTMPAGGHIWATLNAAAGPASWTDRTGAINPGNYPISGIGLDSADATGQTAYVSIMGFKVSHVWKTVNGGVSWSDFSGALPDAPANGVIVDAGTVYVGTDVGVFSTGTGSAAWTEVGPAAGSGPGYLPNVPVTALGMFNSGGSKKLRVSTYGRGIWEFNLISAPDFQLAASNATQSIFSTQSATFNGTVTALNGYASPIALSCSGTQPSTCTPNPTTLVPIASGTGFTLSAASAIGDYSFNLHAVGSDANTVTHDLPLALHVVDYGITSPAPASVFVNRPLTSPSITFQVTGAGSFSGAVTLTCSGLPAGAGCNFLPSSTVNPTSGSPVNITLTISTSSSTPPGTSNVTVSATTAGAPSAKTQVISVTVTANSDYVLSISNPSVSALAGSAATLTGSLTSYNGYASPVTLSCGNGRPPSCTPSDASLTPTAGGAAFTITVSSNAVQNYAFNIVGQGTDSLAIVHSTAVNFASTFDFQISNNSPAQTIKAGGQATYTLDFAPAGGIFPTTVVLSCSGLPLRSTCSFSPPQIAAGNSETPVTLSIATTAPITAASHRRSGLAPLYGTGLWFTAVLAIPAARKRSQAKRLPFLVLLAMLAISEIACGGGAGGSGASGGSGQPGTPAGTYSIGVAGTSGTVTHTVNVTLTVD